MKQIILSIVTFFVPSYLSAQVYVDSNGRMGVGTQPTSTYTLNISSNKGGIKCTAGNQAITYTSAIEGTAYLKGSNETIYGIQGIGAWYGTQTGISYGLYGCSYGSANGMNYGVYGAVLPMVYGAGVYGASTSYNTLQSFNTRYAGYFDGAVCVAGDMTVTGVVTQPSATSSGNIMVSPLQDSYLQASVTRLFGKLTPAIYLMDRQPVKYSEEGVAQTILSDSTLRNMPKDIPLTKMDEQARSKQHYGLDADQLETVFPDLVYENEDGTKSINYVEMVPILVQAINELSAKVASLEGSKDGSVRMSKQVAAGTDEIDENIIALSLGQNKPNPFSNSTAIEVSIPEDVQNAYIYVYDLQGKKVEHVDVTARGIQSIRLSSANLTDGMYLYSLIADGKVVETRRMIVEK